MFWQELPQVRLLEYFWRLANQTVWEKNISKKGGDLADAINEKIDEKFEELLNAISVKIKKAKAEQSASGASDV